MTDSTLINANASIDSLVPKENETYEEITERVSKKINYKKP